MNNKIMLSIRHKYSELILTENKTLEIRKSAPRRGAWGGGAKDTVFLYETKADGGAGAVVGFFSCGAYEATNAFTLHDFKGKEELRRSFITRARLTEDELVAYAQDSVIYGWRVNMVVRFPKPRPLSDFGLTRAPQSWQYLK